MRAHTAADLEIDLGCISICQTHSRSSGEKQTSWGNTLQTHLFMQYAMLQHQIRTNALDENIALSMSLRNKDLATSLHTAGRSFAEGDDGIIFTDEDMSETLQYVAS
jgi:hypothetical protein